MKYLQVWTFPNGQTIARIKFYVTDASARAGTMSSFKRSRPLFGEQIALYRDGRKIVTIARDEALRPVLAVPAGD